MKDNRPDCNYYTCVCNDFGHCRALNEASRACPFFKTTAQHKKEVDELRKKGHYILYYDEFLNGVLESWEK